MSAQERLRRIIFQRRYVVRPTCVSQEETGRGGKLEPLPPATSNVSEPESPNLAPSLLIHTYNVFRPPRFCYIFLSASHLLDSRGVKHSYFYSYWVSVSYSMILQLKS